MKVKTQRSACKSTYSFKQYIHCSFQHNSHYFCLHCTWTKQSAPRSIHTSDTNIDTHTHTGLHSGWLCWDFRLFCHGCLIYLLLLLIVWCRLVSYWRFAPLCCPERKVTVQPTPCRNPDEWGFYSGPQNDARWQISIADGTAQGSSKIYASNGTLLVGQQLCCHLSRTHY